jgi:S1-C subfamily serine protease
VLASASNGSPNGPSRPGGSGSSADEALAAQRRQVIMQSFARQHGTAAGADAAAMAAAAASGQQRRGVLRRLLLSGAAAVALLAAATWPRPAAAFQGPAGMFGGRPPAEAVPVTMENKTPLPDLSQLSPDEVLTIELFKANTPSVVNIANIALARNYYSTDVLKIPQGQGSGFVWDTAGHIVTNFHVIRGASEVQVSLIDQSTYPAKVVGGEWGLLCLVLYADGR